MGCGVGDPPNANKVKKKKIVDIKTVLIGFSTDDIGIEMK
jgi:hypothetical protein